MARGEPPDASPARTNIEITLNQSQIYNTNEVSQSLLKAGFLLRSSMYPGDVTPLVGRGSFHCHPFANMNKSGFTMAIA